MKKRLAQIAAKIGPEALEKKLENDDIGKLHFRDHPQKGSARYRGREDSKKGKVQLSLMGANGS